MDQKTLEKLVETSDRLSYDLAQAEKFQESINQSLITLSLLGFDHPYVLRNLADLYFRIGNPEISVEYFTKYLNITKSNNKDDIRTLAQYLTRSGRMDEAHDVVKNYQVECIEKHLDLGWFLHREGKFKQAFYETEIGRNGSVWLGDRQPPECERWTGQDLTGKKVCAIGEAGLGDEIIFCRWIKDIKQRGADVYYYTNNSLKDVITRELGVNYYDPKIKYDYWIPLMSLPYLLGLESPGNEKYFSPHPTYVDKWKSKFLGHKNIIALNWSGDPKHMENKFRTIPIDYLVNKLKDQGTLVSVCMSAESCPEGVIDLTKDIKHWDDTLAILSLSKTCFTASSSVSVAAGALGIETYLYDLVVGYFTWSSAPNGGLSSWFPNVRVWRQEKFNEWLPVIDQSIDYYLSRSR